MMTDGDIRDKISEDENIVRVLIEKPFMSYFSMFLFKFGVYLTVPSVVFSIGALNGLLLEAIIVSVFYIVLMNIVFRYLPLNFMDYVVITDDGLRLLWRISSNNSFNSISYDFEDCEIITSGCRIPYITRVEVYKDEEKVFSSRVKDDEIEPALTSLRL
jgi:hypothetical protein